MQKCAGLFSCFPESSVKSVRLYEENAAATQLRWKEAGSLVFDSAERILLSHLDCSHRFEFPDFRRPMISLVPTIL